MPRTKAPPRHRIPFETNNEYPPTHDHVALALQQLTLRPLDLNLTRSHREKIPRRPTNVHNFSRSPATQPAQLASAVRGWLHDDFWRVHALRGNATPTTPRGAEKSNFYNSRQAKSLDAALAQYYRDMAPRGRVNGVGAGAYMYRGMLKPATRRWRVGTYTSFSRSKAVAVTFAKTAAASNSRRSVRRRQGIVLRLRASDVPHSISFGTDRIPNLRTRLPGVPGVPHIVTRAEQEVLLPPGVFVLKGSVGRIPGTLMYMYDVGYAASASATSANGSIQLHGPARRLHLAMFRRPASGSSGASGPFSRSASGASGTSGPFSRSASFSRSN